MIYRWIAILATIAITLSCTGRFKTTANGDGVKPGIILVTDGSDVNDESFGSLALRGLKTYYGEEDASRYKIIKASSFDTFLPAVKQACDESPDLIITLGNAFSPAVSEAAKLYPNQKFFIGDSRAVTAPNVMAAAFRERDGGYLVGLTAALKAVKSGRNDASFGLLGGVPDQNIGSYFDGFSAGVRSVLPQSRFLTYYTNDWNRPDLAKTQAKMWYDTGVYAIFAVAGLSTGGVINEAKEQRVNGKDVWVIGSDTDRYRDGLYAEGKSAVLTSVLLDLTPAIGAALNAIQDGSFRGGLTEYGLAEEGISYSRSNTDALDAAILAAVDEVSDESDTIKL